MRYLALILFFSAIPLFAFAATPSQSIFQNVTNQLKTSSTSAGFGTPSDTSVTGTISRLVNTAVGILGVAAVLLLIYAGALWLTAAGSEDKVTTAKKIIRGTVIGMIIVGLAYGITTFVISQLVPAPPPVGPSTQPVSPDQVPH